MLRKKKQKVLHLLVDLSYLLVGLAHIGSLVFAFDLCLFLYGFFNLVGWHGLNSQCMSLYLDMSESRLRFESCKYERRRKGDKDSE